MNQTQVKPGYRAADDELVDVLTEISVVSMRLAKKLLELQRTTTQKRGGKKYGENIRTRPDY